jgi:hypothetical protein
MVTSTVLGIIHDRVIRYDCTIGLSWSITRLWSSNVRVRNPNPNLTLTLTLKLTLNLTLTLTLILTLTNFVANII